MALLFLYIPNRLFHRPGRFIRPFTGQGIKNIGYGGDAANKGDIYPGQAEGIPHSVPSFMMSQRDGSGNLQQFGLGRSQYFSADGTMGFHDGPLSRIEFARFKKNLIGNPDFSDIVHGRGQFNQVSIKRILSQCRGDNPAIPTHSEHMGSRLIVLEFGGAAQAADYLLFGFGDFLCPLCHQKFQELGLIMEIQLDSDPGADFKSLRFIFDIVQTGNEDYGDIFSGIDTL